MTVAGFEHWYARDRVYEGGNDDDPQDPGGRTSRGITQREYDAYRLRNGRAKRDVWTADEVEVRDIYYRQYWRVARCDELPAGIDGVVFDAAVNSGPQQAIKWLQRALEAHGNDPGGVDGSPGMQTLKAVDENTDNDLIVEDMCARRLAMLQGLKTFQRYGKGWTARVANVLKAGVAEATGTIGPPPVPVQELGGGRKAFVEDVKRPAVSAEVGTAASGGAVTLTTANEAVHEAASQIEQVAYVSNVLRFVFVALTIVAIGITAYALWRNSRAKKAVDADTNLIADVPLDADLTLLPVVVAPRLAPNQLPAIEEAAPKAPASAPVVANMSPAAEASVMQAIEAPKQMPALAIMPAVVKTTSRTRPKPAKSTTQRKPKARGKK